MSLPPSLWAPSPSPWPSSPAVPDAPVLHFGRSALPRLRPRASPTVDAVTTRVSASSSSSASTPAGVYAGKPAVHAAATALSVLRPARLASKASASTPADGCADGYASYLGVSAPPVMYTDGYVGFSAAADSTTGCPPAGGKPVICLRDAHPARPPFFRLSGLCGVGDDPFSLSSSPSPLSPCVSAADLALVLHCHLRHVAALVGVHYGGLITTGERPVPSVFAAHLGRRLDPAAGD